MKISSPFTASHTPLLHEQSISYRIHLFDNPYLMHLVIRTRIAYITSSWPVNPLSHIQLRFCILCTQDVHQGPAHNPLLLCIIRKSLYVSSGLPSDIHNIGICVNLHVHKHTRKSTFRTSWVGAKDRFRSIRASFTQIYTAMDCTHAHTLSLSHTHSHSLSHTDMRPYIAMFYPSFPSARLRYSGFFAHYIFLIWCW